MAVSEHELVELANKFIIAEKERTPIIPISSLYPELTIEDAYFVQLVIAENKKKKQDRAKGWKIGATNLGIQAQLGLEEPVYGKLFESQQVSNKGSIALSHLISPRVECEIALLLTSDILGNNSNLLVTTHTAVASLEIVDSRTQGWNVGAREIIADSCIAAGFVLGDKHVSLIGISLAEIKVVLRKNGRVVSRATGEVVLGNPLNAVSWLANKVGKQKKVLKAGEYILTGALSPQVVVVAGDMIEARFDKLGSVSVRFV